MPILKDEKKGDDDKIDRGMAPSPENTAYDPDQNTARLMQGDIIP